MSDNLKVTDKYPSLVITGYIYSAKGEPITYSLASGKIGVEVPLESGCQSTDELG